LALLLREAIGSAIVTSFSLLSFCRLSVKELATKEAGSEGLVGIAGVNAVERLDICRSVSQRWEMK